MREKIINVIKDLKGEKFASERAFQKAFTKSLDDLTNYDGWKWADGSYNTSALPSDRSEELREQQSMKVDIRGFHRKTDRTVAIELKWVLKNPANGKPDDPPAFPYELAKDCLRLDLLRGGKCVSGGSPLPNLNALQTYVIGVTNYSDYWNGIHDDKKWSKEFWSKLLAPVQFQKGIIPTFANEDRRYCRMVYTTNRCHIAFGRSWTGEWIDYGGGMQCLLLAPAPDVKPDWCHDQLSPVEQSEIIPLLSPEARERHFIEKRDQRELSEGDQCENYKHLNRRGVNCHPCGQRGLSQD